MNYLKKAVARSLALVLGLYFSFVSFHCVAWSEKGHHWIMARTLEKLSADEVAYYQSLLDIIQTKGGVNKRKKNKLALASYPDTVRDVLLVDLFARYQAELPRELSAYAQRKTSTWHYHNYAERNAENAHCRFKNKGDLLAVLDLIDRALKTPQTKAQEALLVSFQIHLLQDLHQPLHSITRLASNCKHDLGGNKTCVKKSLLGSCKINLHALWDSGFGLFTDDKSIGLDRQLIEGFSPKSWIQENQKYFDEVYDLARPNYHVLAKNIVEQRTSAAVSRLVFYLKKHYSRKQQHVSK